MPANIPNKLPVPGGVGPTAQGFRIAFGAINQLIDVVRSLMPAKSLNTLTSHTSIGVTRKSKPEALQSRGGGFVWRGEWEASPSEAYAVDDVVIRKADADFDDGTVAGTYIAVEVPTSDDVPGVAPDDEDEDPKWELLSQAHFDHLIIRTSDLADGLVDLNAASANGKRLYVQTLSTCEDGIPMQRMFVCSDPF